MYTPTKEELEELGFTKDELQFILDSEDKSSSIIYEEQEDCFSIVIWRDMGYSAILVFPQSLEDIKTLIRLLTPNE